MYLWNIDNLVQDFRSDAVSQKEEFKYMLTFTVLTILSSEPLLLPNSSHNIYNYICSLSALILSVWGIYYCYKINSEGDNKDFIVRIMCIGLPALIRVFVVSIPIIILASIFEVVISNIFVMESLFVESDESTLPLVVIVIAFIVAYYLYLGKKVKAVSS